MPRRATRFRYGLLSLALFAAGCVNKKVEGSATVYTLEWWVPVLFVLGGLALLGIAVFSLAKKRIWGGVILGLAGLGVLGFGLPSALNDRVVVDDEHFERTSGWISTHTQSARFDELDNITLKSETKMTRRGKRTTYSYVCTKKGGGSEEIPIGDLMREAHPQILANAQKKEVKLIGFEQGP
jgi:hypothetical protein